jgi:hypothetical protein
MRCQNIEISEGYVSALYNANVVITARLHTEELALIAAFNGGEIPMHHQVVRDESVPVQATV